MFIALGNLFLYAYSLTVIRVLLRNPSLFNILLFLLLYYILYIKGYTLNPLVYKGSQKFYNLFGYKIIFVFTKSAQCDILYLQQKGDYFMKVKIIDAICGQGKTSWAKQMMKNNTNNTYLYVTPFKTEIDKLKEDIPSFSAPTAIKSSKHASFNKLLLSGGNIATTHFLFSMCTSKEIEYLSTKHYTLVLDEVMNVISTLPIEKRDYEILFSQNLIKLGEHGKMEWNDPDYPATGVFNDLKNLCSNESIYIVDGVCLIWTLPVSLFECFDEIYILTYDFKSQLQRYYYDLHNIEYEYYSVKNDNGVYSLCDYVPTYPDYDKIHVCDNFKLNAIGSKTVKGHCTALSKSWYTSNKDDLVVLKRNITNFFINICKARSKDIIWTTYKQYENTLKNKGYKTSFLACNARATNNYADRHYIAYTINVFMNPMIQKFFAHNGVKVDENAYALSEFIQFIYRSALREGEDIYCYVPSKRIRELLKKSCEESKLLSK